MRSIEVSTEVFALIWAAREPGEETEDSILLRILRRGRELAPVPHAPPKPSTVTVTPPHKESEMRGKIRWVDDVVAALRSLGGKARLHQIYKQVESQRKAAGRSVPRTLEATIRRTLEDFSSDSANFRGEDLFETSEGLGAGVWALKRR